MEDYSNEKINELRDEWREEAKEITMEKLPAFIEKITNFPHDYSTICHGMALAGVATMKAVNRSNKGGGITGFQAGCVMWDFIREWGVVGDGPLKLVTFDDLLYPQYSHKFEKTIDSDTWKYLQDKAREKLGESGGHPTVRDHWQSIVDGKVPFGFTVKEDHE